MTSAVQDITINIVDADDAPGGIRLNGGTEVSVAEDASIRAVIGTLLGTDPDGDAITSYALTEPSAFFEIVQNLVGDWQVVLKAGVDFENAAERQQVLHVTATANGLTSEPQAITINVTDANDAPTAIDFGTDGLVTTTVSQTATNGSAIATLRTSDPDPVDFHTYSIVTGDGSNQVLINAFAIGIDFQDGKLIVRDAAALATLTGNQQFWIKSADLGGLSTGRK